MMDSKYIKSAITIQRWWRTKLNSKSKGNCKKEYSEESDDEPVHEILTINNNTYIWDLLYSFAKYVYYKIYYYAP